MRFSEGQVVECDLRGRRVKAQVEKDNEVTVWVRVAGWKDGLTEPIKRHKEKHGAEAAK